MIIPTSTLPEYMALLGSTCGNRNYQRVVTQTYVEIDEVLVELAIGKGEHRFPSELLWPVNKPAAKIPYEVPQRIP